MQTLVHCAPIAAFLLAALPAQESGNVQAACDDLLRTYEHAGWSGAALVARDGKALLARGYGKADGESGRANAETTLFEIASLSKQFTAAAILKLEQQGKLETDDSIAKHLPGVPDHARKITILHLLTHTSGMPRNGPGADGEDLKAAVESYLTDAPDSAPGKRFEYWNGGYALLAGIVEQKSGKSFAQYCEDELFTPAGMTDTGFTGDADLDPKRAALGRSESGEPRSALAHPYGSFGYQYRGMGGNVTTVLDLLKWDRALTGSTVLGDKAREKLFTPEQNGYACGWYVGTSSSGKRRQRHDGSVRGFAAEMRRFPEERACVVVLANTDEMKVTEIGENLECLLFGRPLQYALPSPVERFDGDEYAGRWVGKGGTLVVKHLDGELEVGIEGQALLDELLPPVDGSRPPDLESWNAKAVEVIEAIVEGDLRFLQELVLDEKHASWPGHLVGSIWSRQTTEHGPFKSVRALGATEERGHVSVLVAIEHERGSVRARLGFGEKGLQGLHWDGPQFLGTLRLVPKGKDAFEVKRGEKPRRFEFTRKEKRVDGLKTGRLKLQKAG